MLAAAGIYGLLAGSVAERTREIGLRTALGASPRRILGEYLGQGMTLAGAGIALGLAGAVLACGVPAWRPTRVDPARTLRAE